MATFTAGAASYTQSSGPLELASAARYFGERLGWPVSVDVPGKRLVLRTGDVVDVLVLPEWLGERVAAELGTSMMSGPVSTGHDRRWWAFITECCRRANLEIPAELRNARVRAVPRGGHVVLPHPGDAQRWLQRPEPGRLLPPWSAVVALARRALDRRV